MKKYEGYQLGDVVEIAGTRGVITSVDGCGAYPIWVDFGSDNRAQYTADGKDRPWLKEPCVIVIDRPKKKVKKTFYFASCEYGKGERNTSRLYVDVGGAKSWFDQELANDIQIHSIEIEVDDE